MSSLDELLAAADADDGEHRPPGRTISTETASFDHLVRDLVARAEPEARQPQTPRPVPFVPPQPFAPAVPRVISEPVTHDLPAVVPDPPVAPRVEESTDAAPGLYLPRHSRRARLVPASVVALGLPVETGRDGADADPRTALLDVLNDIAVQPPRHLSGVQVVVGAAAAARAVAAEWLAQCGLDPDSAVIDLTGADQQRPGHDTAAITDRINRAVGRFGGVVVVVAGGDTRALARRAGRRIAELGATAVTAVVDARWQDAATGQWLAALAEPGVTIEALAGYGVHESAEPLRLLEHARPVTWLDARPATIGAWAGPCLDRWQ